MYVLSINKTKIFHLKYILRNSSCQTNADDKKTGLFALAALTVQFLLI